MSGFDDNPFGDPFADPSITQATGKTTNGLEDYNPFANQTTKPTTQIRGASNPPQINATNFQPAVINTSNVGPQNQTYSQTTSSTITTTELQRRQEELERKAAELAAREEALRNGVLNIKVNNWPPLPTFLPCNPCFYQDINVEIPVEFQKIVRTMYYLWMYYVAVLFVNLAGSIFIMFDAAISGATGIFIYNLITSPIFTVLSFTCWFRPLYKAFRSDSSFNFMVFFFVFFCQIVLSIIWSFGFLNSLGLTVAINVNGNVFVHIYTYMCTLAHASFSVGAIFMMMKIHSIYRSSGASLERAQAEFSQHIRGTAQEALRNPHVQQAAASAAQEALRNPQVQQAATNAASNAARQAINQSFVGSNANSGVRY